MKKILFIIVILFMSFFYISNSQKIYKAGKALELKEYNKKDTQINKNMLLLYHQIAVIQDTNKKQITQSEKNQNTIIKNQDIILKNQDTIKSYEVDVKYIKQSDIDKKQEYFEYQKKQIQINKNLNKMDEQLKYSDKESIKIDSVFKTRGIK